MNEDGGDMTRCITAFLGALLLVATIVALPEAQAQTAQSVLQTAAKAMGADAVKCLSYTSSGGGYVAIVGQGFSPAEDWPKVELASFARVINYDAKSMREEQVRRQGNYPARGGGGMPIQGEQRIVTLVNGNYAWGLNGTTVNPQPAAAEARQLEIWLDPIGFLKGAMAAKDLVTFDRYEGGGEHRQILAYTVGKFRIQGSLEPGTNRVVRIQTFVPHPLLGDMVEEKTYADYKQFGSVWFPTRFHNHTNWDHELRPQGFFGVPDGGHNSFQITNATVQPDACGETLTVPDAVRTATVAPVRVEAQRLADGVYYMGGGSHASVAVEFSDFVTVVEAPLDEARSLAVIAEVKKVFPNKRIKYVVNTHHHFDHSGGLRTYVHEGAIPIAHREIIPYYYYTVMDLSPRTLAPDRLSLYPPDEYQETFVLEAVQNDKYTITDGTRILDLHLIEGNPHATGMLMAYLPKEKILVEADLYTPPAANTPPIAKPTPAQMSLYNNVQRLKLPVDRIASIHGRVVPWSEFTTYIGRAGTQ
jgi:glyoxylase-like metal-dependent hydrolase (beta-lactamase superfamily II)